MKYKFRKNFYVKRIRKLDNKERWTKKCPKCKTSYIPNEYRECDYCFLGQFKFSTQYDALDFLCFKELIPEAEVLRVLRIINDGVYVTGNLSNTDKSLMKGCK